MNLQKCPACPDGNQWGPDGPTGKACIVCHGSAYIAVTMTGYLGQVAEYWEKDGKACARCDMQDEPGRCAMLHDPAIPVGNCLGLLERDNIEQPEEA